LGGDIGADRKDTGMLIKVFLDTFRRVPKKSRPALILKTSGAGFSVIDREMILQRIEHVKNNFNATNLPSVYLLHGDLTDEELNSLYNHPKIKANVTFTKGEGFGRPLLEFSMTGKPIIASGWSGHLDFLTPDESLLLGGKLGPVHPSAVWNGVINEGTHWFNVDYVAASKMLYYVWKQYSAVSARGMKQVQRNADNFSYDAILQKTKEIFTQYIPEFKMPEEVEFSLPNLPALQKIEVSSQQSAEEHGMDIPDNAEGPTKTSQVPQEVGADG
jgi:glycosyltransferase involved in cell wall biosynthesis